MIDNLIIKQDPNKVGNIKRAVSLYPDSKHDIENVNVSNLSFDFEEEKDGSVRLLYVPKQGVKSVKVRP